jgi:hypothetical protein
MDTVILNNESHISVETKEPLVVTVPQNDSILSNTEHYNRVTVEDQYNTVVEQVTTEIVSTGPQGPQGPPGSSLVYTYLVAAENIGGNRAVTTNSSGQLVYAQTTSTHIIGISKAATTAGEVCEVQTLDVMLEPSWAFTVNMPVFATDNGLLTQVAPETGNLHILGYAITPTKLFIDKQLPITLG